MILAKTKRLLHFILWGSCPFLKTKSGVIFQKRVRYIPIQLSKVLFWILKTELKELYK